MGADRDGSGEITTAAIQRARIAVRQRLKAAECQREELDSLIEAAKTEEGLLDQLLSLRRGDAEVASVTANDARPTPRRSSAPSKRKSKHPAVEAAMDELTKATRPLHISDLMRLLYEREVTISRGPDGWTS